MNKYLIILLIFVSTINSAQAQSNYFVQGNIRIKTGNLETSPFSIMARSGEIDGCVIIPDVDGGLIQSEINFGLGELNTEYFKVESIEGNIKSTDNDVKRLLNKEIKLKIYKRFLRLYLSPVANKRDGDSIKIFCKTLYFVQKNEPDVNTVNYDIIYNEYFLNVPLEKEFELKMFRSYLASEQKLYLKFSNYTDYNAVSNMTAFRSVQSLNNYKTFSKMRKDAKLILTNLKLGMELIRTDIKNEKIVDRQLLYPMEKKSLGNPADSDSKRIEYRGAIKVPLVIYNPEKQRQFNDYYKNRTDNYKMYTLQLATIQKNGNKYKFAAMINIRIGEEKLDFVKEFEVEVGGRIKIELMKDNWQTEILSDGKIIKIDLKEDFHKYINEYLIISLESED